ncbi:hypothetical protein TKK_0013999 [Trichogramma kaykai]|uniref:Laminin subunit alpha n=1 Tax=Trichogramma kaykai TaxID=54128 RepID=A0ABD2WG72_9HYME
MGRCKVATQILAALLLLQCARVHAEILTPPYFNLAEGKEIFATATCGVDTPEPELYCQLVGANSDQEPNHHENIIQGQQCDYCDPNDEEKKHPAEYAVDGLPTWWQSPPLSRGKRYEEVNLTINLGQEFHVAYVYIRMGNSPRPDLWILEKSKDFGKTWSPWQYFSGSDSDCQTYFGINSHAPISRDDSVICTTEYSKIVPLEGGEIPVSILNNRPSAKHYFNSTILQEWTRATNVRFRFLKTKNLLGHLMSVKRQDPTVTRRYFYSIKDISIGGRCFCNGHADTCDSLNPESPKELFCRCQHNTCGAQCDTCCKGFEQKKWRQSTYSKKFVCEPCNCFGHSDECEYDPEIDEKHLSLDMHGNYEGGGRCKNCKHNTEGINCNRCKPKFYRPHDKAINATDVCQPCNCNFSNSTGNCFDGDGKCECSKEYTAPNCDSCSYGYYGFPNCRPCDCVLNATDGDQCEAINGVCSCKENFAGHYCDICAEEYYGFPDCFACECNPTGSLNNVCDVISGNCTCKNNYGGRKCDMCEDGYYNYPHCTYCQCDNRGTEPGVCDKGTGQCLCKEGYGGPRCDQCLPGYFGFPNCEPCNCSKSGSTATSCDATGKCSCLSNFVGKTCNQCAPGYYNYPDCTSCNCDSHGSIGVSCDHEGKCNCRENFDGDRCDMCKENYYNFPTCEGCNCDPAGIAGTFQGCGSLPVGELCQCKDRVEGRICNKCKKLFWNLQSSNPDGCEECFCSIPGVIGSIGECDGKTGQCICKPSVTGRDCTMCVDGTYNLQETNLFGCTDCACDIGGSLSKTCNKQSGQCQCRHRIEGRTCDEPMRAHYFPTLHQFQYEAEEGRTPNNRSVRYKFDEDLFPGFSWQGYAVFSSLQNKIIHEIDIQKSSLYRMVLRYVNPNSEPILGSVTITPDSHTEAEQHFEVQFKPTGKSPTFVTVAGAQGLLASVMVMNPGHWAVTIGIEKNLFLDYFVLLPAEYYEASILTEEVSTPCVIGYKGLCRQYAYPSLQPFDVVLGTSGFTGTDSNRYPLTEYLTEPAVLDEIDETKMPLVNDRQNKINFELAINKPGAHVIVVTYVTPPPEISAVQNVAIKADSGEQGKATLYPCPYTSVCRQVVVEDNGKIAEMYFPSNFVNIVLEAEPNVNVAIKSIVAVPAQDWSIDYLNPKSVCVRKEGSCIGGVFPEAPDAKKVELELNNQLLEVPVVPEGIYDNSSKFIYLNGRDSSVDVPAKVQQPGEYVFVIKYYQPDYPEFDIDVIVQNGKVYEAKIPMTHCPSNAGCRSLMRQPDGNKNFQLTDNFVITLKDNSDRGIYLDYILVIPADLYSDEYLRKKQFDQTKEFIKRCGNNNFHINTTEEGFCRDSVFSLTANFNDGALSCNCDIDGTISFECEKFGGQCPCKPNIIGRRCNVCKTGFFGFPNCRPCNCPSTALCDPDNGSCICPSNVIGALCDQCKPGTYGYDPVIGCEECQCDYHGVQDGDLQCDLLTGNCKCKENVVNRQCNRCKAGHHSFPYCDQCSCDVAGTRADICDQATAECICKDNVQGADCSQCKDGMFNLQASNEQGCTQCFCFGKTTRCTSSSLIRSHLMEMSGWDVALVNERNENVEILEVVPQKLNDTHILVDMAGGIDEKQIIYFSAPPAYLNKKLVSYGGWFNYTIYYTTGLFGQAVPGGDVVLQGADNFLIYRGDEQPPSLTNFQASVRLEESNFVTKQGRRATREAIMSTLKDLRGIYIRATYWQPSLTVSLSHVSIDVTTDEWTDNAEIASSVEHCQCPPNYKGFSCEECAKGYYRVKGSCVKCQCNGHADECDVNTGICIDCKNGTTGDHCEMCQEGYYGDATIGTPSDCLICACPLPIASNNFAKGCEVSEDGSKISCSCLPGYYGARCESCAAGYYGQPENVGDYCKPCECSGNIDTNEIGSCDSVSGECLHCLNNTYGTACNLCKPGYFGDAIERKDCKSCSCDQCGMKSCDNQNGICQCHDNVIGEECNRCAPDHYGFKSCQGCRPCECGIASESSQCDDDTGKCVCKPGVEGRTCDQCMAGYWNYGPEGCIPCGCITKYSRGASCNPVTGQCVCLPGVLGEKCDNCPHRTVLDPRRGCQTCDKCIHDLLDVTDELKEKLDPVADSFQNVADSYFTNQRLDFINETVNELGPEVKLLDPRRVNLDPEKNTIGQLNNKVFSLKRDIEYQEQNSHAWKTQAEDSLKDTYDLEHSIIKEIDLVNTIISEVQSLAQNTEQGHGPKTESALKESQDLLAKIKQVSFIEDRDKATDQVTQANILNSEMIAYEEPVKDLEDQTNQVIDDVHELEFKIDDMYNLTHQADELANAAERINFENKKTLDSNSLASLKDISDHTNNDIVKGDELIKEASSLVAEAEYKFINANTSMKPGDKPELSEQLDNLIKENEDMLVNHLREDVPKARKHAQEMNEKSIQIEDLFTNTRNLTGVRAASAYQDIVNSIEGARNFAEDALRSVESATTMAVGLDVNSNQTEMRSKDLWKSAVGAFNETQRKLKPDLENARNLHMQEIAMLNEKNNGSLDKILKSLNSISVQSSMIAQESLNNADKAEFGIGDAMVIASNNHIDQIPDDVKKIKSLAKVLSDANRNISQATHQVDTFKNFQPKIEGKLVELNEKQQLNNQSGNHLHDKIEDLKRKISNARDLANRIRIGLTFVPNTMLELQNPESLAMQTTATKISLYFRTPRTNGFLLYLGNENRPTSLRGKTHDFMALSIEGGYPVLTLDLGSGTQRINHNKYVSDNEWRQLVVEKTGRNIKLIVREEMADGQPQDYVIEQSLPGSHSIFNLDQEKSKLFVGSIPDSFQVQETLDLYPFDGEMEDLMIGDAPVSFWNFIKAENNWKPAYERTKLINMQPPTGYRFDRGGYALLSKKSLQLPADQKRFRVQFKFKTYVNNGLMYLMGGKKHFLAVELRDGHVLYQFDLGDGELVMPSPKKYNDGEWHTVEVLRLERIGVLKIDGEQISQLEAPGESKNLVSNDYVYFGGHLPTSTHPYKTVTQIGFEGCIDEVSMQEIVVDITKNLQAYGVVAGCPIKFASLVSFHAANPGYVKWDKVIVPDALQINLKFRTRSENGVIYHLTNSDGTPANTLTLEDGQLVLISQGEKLQTNTPEIKFNDNEWHVVTATHNGSTLRLDIDDTEEEMLDNVDIPRQINDGVLYVGNVPDNVKNGLSFEPFVGCIGDTTLNGVIVNFANSTERPHAHLAQCPKPDQTLIIDEGSPSMTLPPPPPEPTGEDDNVVFPGQEDNEGKEFNPRFGETTDSPSSQSPEPQTSPVPVWTTTLQSPTSEEPLTVDGCRLPQIPLEDPDQQAERTWRFGTKPESRFEFSALGGRYKDSFAFQIDIKTLANEGVVFFGADFNKRDLIALFIKDGLVHFTFDCGSGPAELISEQKINDNHWHAIYFKREGTRGELIVDQNEPVTQYSQGTTKSISVEPPFFVGGLDPSFSNKATKAIGVNQTFSGCIRNFMLNGQYVTGPSVVLGVIPCSKRVEPGMFFYPGNGSNYFKAEDKFSVGKNMQIQMDIKPRSASGLLLAIHGKNDYLVLEMVNGTIKFLVKAAKGQIETSYQAASPNALCDGNWHVVRAVKQKNVVILSVDHQHSSPGIGNKNLMGMPSKNAIYIGGHPNLEAGKPLKGSVSRAQYVGCINNLTIRNVPYALDASRIHGNVIANVCPTT